MKMCKCMKTRGFQHPKGISDVMLWTMIGLALALIALAILASIAGSQTTLVKNDIEIQRESVYTMPVYGPCHDYEEADFSWKVLR